MKEQSLVQTLQERKGMYERKYRRQLDNHL
jgi:hypothetical protein